MPWKMFVATETDFACQGLRRYSSNKCSGGEMSYHNAEVVINPKLSVIGTDLVTRTDLEDEFQGDPRWPSHCRCGYKFHPEDHWQVNVNRLYEGDEREPFALREAPIGATWHAEWLDHPMYVGPDGKAWCVMLPGDSEWVIYGRSVNGKGWDITGEIPNITVSPSIHRIGQYHGFIKKGIISEDVGGLKYPDVPRTA